MTGVTIDLEKHEVVSSVDITQAYKELELYYRGNDAVLSYTFPLMVLGEESIIHKDRHVATLDGLYFYANHPWKFTFNKDM